jgi:hypothetical protein
MVLIVAIAELLMPRTTDSKSAILNAAEAEPCRIDVRSPQDLLFI